MLPVTKGIERASFRKIIERVTAKIISVER